MIKLVSNDRIVPVDVSVLFFLLQKTEGFILINLGTRSRGSITMRMLMGTNDVYADGKVQSTITNGL